MAHKAGTQRERKQERIASTAVGLADENLFGEKQIFPVTYLLDGTKSQK